MLAVGARLLLLVVASAEPAPSAPVAPLSIRSGRTTTVVASVDVGAPIERALPSAAYAQAATADAEERWEDAQPLYRRAIAEWTATSRTRPTRVLELAIAKAERELRASQTLAFTAQNARLPDRLGRMPEDARRTWQRRQALDEGRLLSAKLLATRATLGRVPAALYVHTRNRLEEARNADLQRPNRTGTGTGAGSEADAEVELLLCTTYAAGDAQAPARLARARVTETERDDPANAPGVAACAAALGDTQAALFGLEAVALRPVPGRPDRFLNDLYLSNDWDHLRGNPRFESLFPR